MASAAEQRRQNLLAGLLVATLAAAAGCASPTVPAATTDSAPRVRQADAVEPRQVPAGATPGDVRPARPLPQKPYNPAVDECARLSGRLLGRTIRVTATTAGSATASITLMGDDWCETRMGPAEARTFFLVTPRVDARRRNPDASQWQMDAVAVQIRAFPQGSVRDPETLRARLQQALETGGAGTAIYGFAEFARRPGVVRELGPTDTRTGCVPLRVSGELPAGRDPVTGVNPPHPRQFMMRAQLCLGPPGAEGAAGLTFLRESTAGDAGAAGRAAVYDALAEQIFASFAFGPAPRDGAASAAVSPECQVAATAFDQSFGDTAALLRVAPQPGAAGALDVAIGVLLGVVDVRIADESTRQRCFTEVLRARGFRNAPPYAAARHMLGSRSGQPSR